MRNVLWNLLGTAAPLVVAVPVVPILIRRLGTDRFGVLTLAWALIGYAGFFDLGLGRALTQVVSRKLGTGEEHEVPGLFWTSVILMSLFGILAMVGIVALSPWLSEHALKIPTVLQSETIRAFYILGISAPVVIASTGLRGLLEAYQRFDLVNALRIPMGVFTFAGPFLILPFTVSLPGVLTILLLGRLLGCAGYLWLCLHVVPELRQKVALRSRSVGPLLRFGGWLTVGNIVGPMMMFMDRFVIAAVMSAAAVTYYATPYEVVTKLLYIPIALASVMFPAFGLSSVANGHQSVALYRRSMWYLFATMLPLTLLLVAGARPMFSLWLGASFAENCYVVARLLLFGVFALAMGGLPVVLLQGLGRPDVPPKINLLELPFYVALLYLLVLRFGIVGAAFAWMLRTTVDTLLLLFFAHRIQQIHRYRIDTIQMAHAVSADQ